MTMKPAPTSAYTETVAGNVRAELARRGWSQTYTAEVVGIAQSGISARQRGVLPWALAELGVLADAMRVDVTTLTRAAQGPRGEAVGAGVRPEGFEPPTFWFGASGRPLAAGDLVETYNGWERVVNVPAWAPDLVQVGVVAGVRRFVSLFWVYDVDLVIDLVPTGHELVLA